MTDGYWTFTDPSLDIKGITISEGSDIMSNSLEVAQIYDLRSRALDMGDDARWLREPRLGRLFRSTRDQVCGRLIELGGQLLQGPPRGGPFSLRRFLALPLSHPLC